MDVHGDRGQPAPSGVVPGRRPARRPDRTFSAQDSTDPEALWSALADYESLTGGRAMAIPHNGNLSNGRMFSPTRNGGQAFDLRYAQQRRYWEPLYEMTQVKGDAETHPLLSPEDPLPTLKHGMTAISR